MKDQPLSDSDLDIDLDIDANDKSRAGVQDPRRTLRCKASRTPECGTLCCRRWRMELCSMWRGALPLLFLISPRPKMKSSAPHPAEPELPWARAELRALRTAFPFPFALSPEWHTKSAPPHEIVPHPDF
jgi:hypothetical protein